MVVFPWWCQKAGGHTSLGDTDVMLPRRLQASFSGPIGCGSQEVSELQPLPQRQVSALFVPDLFPMTLRFSASRSLSSTLTVSSSDEHFVWQLNSHQHGRYTADVPAAWTAATRAHTHKWRWPFGQQHLSGASWPQEWHSVKKCVS